MVIFTDNTDNLIEKIKNNSEDENKKLASELKEKLSEGQSSALSKLLSDKKLVSEIMNSPRAKEILRKLNGDKNGYK